ncbi:hypothetical protein Taro_023468 [Colocasia esculenta]|uniref:DUF1639 family protein n=1 Tax=Colocasia esculenta TaxID=4460 RepID=A0A843V3V9_COLES|nr:hypothetical protein [Colocasia esculenta]
MLYPGDVPRAVEVMTAAAAAASSSSPSPPAHRPVALGGKPRSRHPIAPFRAAWANQRLLQCAGVDGDGDASVASPASSLPAPSTERKPAGSSDDGFERIRAKLMDHLREAVGRIELPAVSPGEGRSNQPAVAPVEEADDRDGHRVSPAPSSSPASAAAVPGASASASLVPGAAAAVEELPWNLRTRKSTVCNGRQPSQHPTPSPSSPTPSPAPSPPAKQASRLRSGAPERSRRRRSRFSVPLTKEEIDEDLYAFTGRRASRRPKKRPRIVQKQLDMLFPGLWLSEVTADIYQVADRPPILS